MIKLKFNLKFTAAVFFLIQITAATALLSFPSTALAQKAKDVYTPLQYTPEVKIPVKNSGFDQASTSVGKYSEIFKNGTTTGIMTSDLLPRYIRTLYDYGLAIAGILATLVLMAGGIIWMVSGGDSGKVGQAKELITGSISGLVILVVAWIILNTINPDLINLKPLQTPIAKRQSLSASVCCDPKLGTTYSSSNDNCKNKVTKGCEGDMRCANDGKNNFSCITDTGYICCEFDLASGSKGFNKRCESHVYAGTGTKAVSGCQTPAGYSYVTSYLSTNCGNKNLIGAKSCISGSCDGKADGDNCEGINNVNYHCYGGDCWFGTAGPGEYCGNRIGSSCYLDKNNTKKCGKTANGTVLNKDTGGRMCNSGYLCCNINNSQPLIPGVYSPLGWISF